MNIVHSGGGGGYSGGNSGGSDDEPTITDHDPADPDTGGGASPSPSPPDDYSSSDANGGSSTQMPWSNGTPSDDNERDDPDKDVREATGGTSTQNAAEDVWSSRGDDTPSDSDPDDPDTDSTQTNDNSNTMNDDEVHTTGTTGGSDTQMPWPNGTPSDDGEPDDPSMDIDEALDGDGFNVPTPNNSGGSGIDLPNLGGAAVAAVAAVALALIWGEN